MIKSLLLLSGLMATLASGDPEPGQRHIVLLLSKEAAPYRSAEAQLRADLSDPSDVQLETVVLGPKVPQDDIVGDMVIAIGSRAARHAMQHASEGTPLGYCLVTNPVKLGLTRRPRTFGVSTQVSVRDQLEFLRRVAPGVTKVGYLYDPQTTNAEQLAALREELPRGWELVAVGVKSQSHFADSLDALFRRSPDVVWARADARIYRGSTIRALLVGSLRQRVPVFGYSESVVRAGALAGVSIDPRSQGAELAALVIRQLTTSASRSDHRAPKFRTAINLIVADKMDIEIPESVVRSASQVFRPKDGH